MDNNLDQTYQLPQEINAELTLKYGIPVRVLLVLVAMWLFSQNTKSIVYPPFEIAWYIWNILVGFILCVKSTKNKEKVLAYSLLLFLSRGKGEYKSIDNPKSIKDMKESVKDETPDNEYSG